MKKPTFNKLEEQTFFNEDFDQIPPNDIVAYNELRSCADLLRLKEQGTLNIQPEFQRDLVWSASAQTRFVDSLIKQLPIPSLCFSYDYKTEKWQVIDGLQRMSTIIRFLSDEDWKLSNLDDITPDIANKTVKTIKENTILSKYFSRVQNTSLPITVLRCDTSKKSHKLYLFTIFHRLNTGGMKLNNQEIRNCIYAGSLNKLLKTLDSYDNWRKLNKMQPKKIYRFTKQEIILRYFAFCDNLHHYNGRLAQFLNEYMSENQNPNDNFLKKKEIIFKRTVDVICNKLFSQDSIPKLSITLIEALLYGVSSNIDSLENKKHSDIEKYYKLILGHKDFSEENLREGLASKEKVKGRLSTTKTIFSAK